MAMLRTESGAQIYFEHQRRDSGKPTVLLSHGWGMACRVWDNTTACLLDNGYSVVGYDHRNCGRSDKDFADVSIEALGDDVAALCDALALDRVVLNGWSLGGAVVIDAAAKIPDRLAGAVLTGGATPRYTQADGFPHGGTPADVAATVAALRAERVSFLKGLYFEGVFAGTVSDDIKHWCWQIALQASSGADASLGALASIDQREIMANITAPALVFAGEQDGVVPADIGRFAASLLPDAELVVMNCGHAPFLELPDEYHQKLTSFLQGVSS